MHSKAIAFLPFIILFTGLPLYAQEWQSEVSTALRSASQSNKKVLLYFSAGKSCEECRVIEESVFSTDAFLEYAQPLYVLTRVAFDANAEPEKKAENLLVVEKYNKDGFFPFVVVVDRSGRVIGNTGIYEGEDAEAFIRKLRALSR